VIRAVAFAAFLAAAAPVRAHDCALVANPDHLPIVRLDAAAVDSIGRGLSDFNIALIDRIDEAYRVGHYGEPGSKEAKRDARAALIYNAKVAFDFVRSIAGQDEAIYSTSEEDLREAFTRSFRNPGIYPILNLRDARAGVGRFCMQFDVQDARKRKVAVSGEDMRSWTEQIEIDGELRPVVNIDMKTFSHDRIHVVYEEYACGAIREFDAEMDGLPLRVFAMEELQGQYVRKHGFHKPHAMILWKAPGDGALDPPPLEGRFLGSAVYFPHLDLDLPWFLPSIGFNDLRKFEFPEPILTLDATQEVMNKDLEWLEIKKNARFANWEGDGEVPEFVQERFPDF
jgi:hypothetical protein